MDQTRNMIDVYQKDEQEEEEKEERRKTAKMPLLDDTNDEIKKPRWFGNPSKTLAGELLFSSYLSSVLNDAVSFHVLGFSSQDWTQEQIKSLQSQVQAGVVVNSTQVPFVHFMALVHHLLDVLEDEEDHDVLENESSRMNMSESTFSSSHRRSIMSDDDHENLMLPPIVEMVRKIQMNR